MHRFQHAAAAAAAAAAEYDDDLITVGTKSWGMLVLH
jgi:hypothetical protein